MVVTVGAATSPNTGNLTALEFVLTEPLLGTPGLGMPIWGADNVGIVTPNFTWTAVPGATAYEFELTENLPGAVDLFAIVDEEAAPLSNGYRSTLTLKYDTQYNWRARAISATEEGAWVTGFFTTAMEPAEVPEAPPPVIVEENPPAEITVEIPPAQEVQVIPDYLLWVVVAVGAVLVIAVIVLIVRTRRVA